MSNVLSKMSGDNVNDPINVDIDETASDGSTVRVDTEVYADAEDVAKDVQQMMNDLDDIEAEFVDWYESVSPKEKTFGNNAKFNRSKNYLLSARAYMQMCIQELESIMIAKE